MQKIASAFFCESKFYNLNDFSKRLKIDEECARKVIARLLAANIIKPTSRRAFDMDELQSEEIILEEPFFLNYENGFSFCFVGIICTENCVLKCLPKYFENDADEKPFEKNPKNILHFKKVLKAIQKYKSAKSENLYLYYDAGQKENFNRLAMEIFCLKIIFQTAYTRTSAKRSKRMEKDKSAGTERLAKHSRLSKTESHIMWTCRLLTFATTAKIFSACFTNVS